MYERSVPIWIARPQSAGRGLADDGLTDLAADGLRRDRDPRRALTQGPVVSRSPIGRVLEAGRHVVPLDEDRPVELLRTLRPEHDDARLVRRAALRAGGPQPVGAEGYVGGVRRRGPLDEVLLLYITESGK